MPMTHSPSVTVVRPKPGAGSETLEANGPRPARWPRWRSATHRGWHGLGGNDPNRGGTVHTRMVRAGRRMGESSEVDAD